MYFMIFLSCAFYDDLPLSLIEMNYQLAMGRCKDTLARSNQSGHFE